MRISKDDRRRLNRRLRDRIPAALTAGLKATRPLALIVAATVCLSPEAMAKVKEKKAEPVLVMTKETPNEYEVSYDRKDMKGPPENPTQGLANRIMEEVNGLLDRMWRAQSVEKLETTYMAKDPEPWVYGMHIAAMKKPPKTRYSDGEKIRKHFNAAIQVAASERVKGSVGVLDQFESGLRFNLNLEDTDTKTATKTNSSKGKIRYGLVLKDIHLTDKGPDRAALGDDTEELNYAGHADVVWTIGPIEGDDSRRIFNIKPPTDGQKDDSLWARIRMPKAAFTGNVTPDDLGNLANLKDDSKLPGATATIRQVEDYYVMTYQTDSKGEKQKEEHTFKVPVVGTLEVGRRFDDKFHVIQTSAHNILIDKRMPLVSIHYMNMEQRFKGTLGTNLDGHSISFSAIGEGTGTAPEEIRKKKKEETYMQEHYKINYSKKF